MKIPEIFSKVVDFRKSGMISHKLCDILTISLFAILCGADDFEEIEEFGLAKQDFFIEILELPNGIPSHDTFNRVLKLLDSSALEKCLKTFSEAIIKDLSNYQISIDGKVIRATASCSKRNSGLCLVSAWVGEHSLSLGQVKVDKKSNEKTALPLLLSSIALSGNLVSIDAMGCHKNIANLITKANGDYLLALKKNQKGIYEQVHDFMLPRKADLQCVTSIDYVGGRIEERIAYVSVSLEFIDDLADWEAKSMIMIESKRSYKNGSKPAIKSRRFYISSELNSASYFLKATRNHWSIENSLHWQLDVTFKEDKQRVRTQNGAENMAVLRKLGLQVLKKNKEKRSIKNTRKKAGWSDEFLLQITQDFFS